MRKPRARSWGVYWSAQVTVSLLQKVSITYYIKKLQTAIILRIFQDDLTAGFDLQGGFTGQANRVETGVEIEGIVAARYEIRAENLSTDSDFSNVTDASLYIARDGGYIVRVEVNGTAMSGQGKLQIQAERLYRRISIQMLADLHISSQIKGLPIVA